MSSKRKRDSEDDGLSTPSAKLAKQEEVTRSGRVRKKPAKFIEDKIEEIDVKPEIKTPRPTSNVSQVLMVSPPIQQAKPVSPTPPAKVVMMDFSQSQKETSLKDDSFDEDAGKNAGRVGRARKKSAKVLEMEEFEEAEKKQVNKKDATKKVKTPGSPTFLNQKGVPKQGVLPGPSVVSRILTSPSATLKIKDIQTAPKIETVSQIALQLSPQKKSPLMTTPKSPVAAVATSPEGKGSVIKLLLSSPTQSANPILSTTSVSQLSPPMDRTPTASKKKAKAKDKSNAQSDLKIKQALKLAQVFPGQTDADFSPIKQALSIDTSIVKTDTNEELDEKGGSKHSSKDAKVKKGKKTNVKDETVFMPPPLPSPNVIHVGAMNMGLEIKNEPEGQKKKKSKLKSELERQKEKTHQLGMEDAMMDDEFGLDMSEITLGDAGDDSFMDIDDDDLVLPDEDDIDTMRPKSKSAKKKKLKTGKGNVAMLGDSDGDLVMDFARMKSDKSDEKKKKKQLKEQAKELEMASKKKRAPTAYMLWCNVNRPKVVAENPGIDFSSISKTLGEMWSTLSEKDKMLWKRKAKKAAGKGSTLITTGKATAQKVVSQAPAVITSRPTVVTAQKVQPALATALLAAKQQPKPVVDDVALPVKGFGIDPVDVAAHLKIVGESLSIIGMRLQEHRGLIAVQGSLSVLLDSMLCAVAPLMCLTATLPEMDGLPHQVHMKNLDNIAYIMPGL